jgi:hypothetical protein
VSAVWEFARSHLPALCVCIAGSILAACSRGPSPDACDSALDAWNQVTERLTDYRVAIPELQGSMQEAGVSKGVPSGFVPRISIAISVGRTLSNRPSFEDKT